MNIFQPSLFGDKADFDAADLTKVIEDNNMDKIVADAVKIAFANVSDYRNTYGASYILFASLLHERIFSCIKDEFSKHEFAESMQFGECSSGNERQYFQFRGYTFIIKKYGASTNSTKQSDVILNQESGNHIITISYIIDELRESLTSISFMYIKGGITIFEYNMDSSNITIEQVPNNLHEAEIPKAKPRLKRGVKKEIS